MAYKQSISAPAKFGAPLQARYDSICGAALRLALRPITRSGAPTSAPTPERSAPTALRQKIKFINEMKNGAFNYAYGANVNNSSYSRLCEACLGYETSIGYLKLVHAYCIP